MALAGVQGSGRSSDTRSFGKSVSARARRAGRWPAWLRRWKEINGRKRHIVVDTLGLILRSLSIQADVQDHDGAVLVLRVLGQLKARFHRLKAIFADSAYGRINLPGCVKGAFGWLLQTVLRPANFKGLVVLPKRWIVERTFGWLGRYRRHSKDYGAILHQVRQ